jgi:hypothetical protein
MAEPFKSSGSALSPISGQTPYDWANASTTYQPGSTSQLPSFGGKYSANDTWAYITRQQWDDYMSRFAPLEEKMIGMTTYANPEIVNQEVAKGTEKAASAIGNYGEMGKQYLSRFGAALDPRQEMQTQRMENLTTGSAVSDAAARIRQNLLDQNRQIAFGMSTGGGINPSTPK